MAARMKKDEHMILRTVYLPHQLEVWLKRAAHFNGGSKNAIIREALEHLLPKKYPEHRPEGYKPSKPASKRET